jgi:hypothetical protein
MDILSEQGCVGLALRVCLGKITYDLPTVRNILWYVPFKRFEGNAPEAC